MLVVVGVGAVGGACAAALCSVTDDVVLGVRRMSFQQLTVEGLESPLTVMPKVESSPDGLGPAEWLLLATKAHQVAGAEAWFRECLGPETRVAVLQNGVEHAERVASWVARERVLPVVVDCPAVVRKPGLIRLRRAPRLTVPQCQAGRDLARLFENTYVECEESGDFVSALWRKLCINVTGGALAALAGVPLPEIRHPLLPKLARCLAQECALVARAEGAKLSDDEVFQIADRASQATSGGVPSTLTDRLAGRQLESDARNGAVVRFGARHGIETPFNRRAATLLMQCHQRQGNLLDELCE